MIGMVAMLGIRAICKYDISQLDLLGLLIIFMCFLVLRDIKI